MSNLSKYLKVKAGIPEVNMKQVFNSGQQVPAAALLLKQLHNAVKDDVYEAFNSLDDESLNLINDVVDAVRAKRNPAP